MNSYYNNETLIEQQRIIWQLQEENAALIAHIKALREAYDSYVETGFDEIIDDAFAATPQQHLAEIRAEAGRDGFVAGYKECCLQVFGTDEQKYTASYPADKYADSIRQGV